MRKFLLSILLASAAAGPALAEPPHRNGSDDPQSESSQHQPRSNRSNSESRRSESGPQRSEARQEAHEVRVERTERPDRSDRSNTDRRADVERPAVVERQIDSERPAVVERQIDVERPANPRDRARVQRQAIVERHAEAPNRRVEVERTVREVRHSNVNERGRPTLGEGRKAGDSVTNWRSHERPNVSDRTSGSGEQSRRVRVRPPVEARPDRPAPRPATASRDTHHHHWRTDWRHDHKYDWHKHRHHHRSLFHLGFYFDPFGWSYHRWGIGWRLWPSYYSSDYWLNDPYQYRLPYPPWPYRWVRYYNDALLVDTYTGEVVDVIYGFFW